MFTFLIKKDPSKCKIDENIIVEYVACGTLSEQHSDNTTVHSLKLSHLQRLEVANDVTDKSVNAYFYDHFDYVENTNLALNYGNQGIL